MASEHVAPQQEFPDDGNEATQGGRQAHISLVRASLASRDLRGIVENVVGKVACTVWLVIAVVAVGIYFSFSASLQTVSGVSEAVWQGGKVVLTVPGNMADAASKFFHDKEIVEGETSNEVMLWKGVHDLHRLANHVKKQPNHVITDFVKDKFAFSLQGLDNARNVANSWVRWNHYCDDGSWGSVGLIGIMSEPGYSTKYKVFLGFKEAKFRLKYKHLCGGIFLRNCEVNLDGNVKKFLERLWESQVADRALENFVQDVELQYTANPEL